MTKDLMKAPKRQLAFVADLNKCIGCQTCTIACKKMWTTHPGQAFMYWRNVETAPGMGYPKNWQTKGGGYKAGELVKGKLPPLGDYGVPFEFDYQGRLFEGTRSRANPSPTPRWAPNWDEDQGVGAYPNNAFMYLPRMCNHCSKPACVEACPSDAIYKREEDGLVVINLELCKGKKNCIESCPYAKPYFNSVIQKANKCIGCYPRVEKGVAPACVAQCVGRAMHVGFIGDANSSVHKLTQVWKVALPLHPEFDTGPNVFYVPPFLGPTMEDAQGSLGKDPKLPTAFLQELFGPDVVNVLRTLKDERAKKMAGQASEVMDVLIGRRSADMMISPLT